MIELAVVVGMCGMKGLGTPGLLDLPTRGSIALVSENLYARSARLRNSSDSDHSKSFS
jgi:hypothetical protein